jgi:hypothetical protein
MTSGTPETSPAGAPPREEVLLEISEEGEAPHVPPLTWSMEPTQEFNRPQRASRVPWRSVVGGAVGAAMVLAAAWWVFGY